MEIAIAITWAIGFIAGALAASIAWIYWLYTNM